MDERKCILNVEMGNADSRNRPAGSGFILFSVDHSKLLLVQDANTKKWGFPKGHMEDYDASDYQTAVRECQEETGLKESDYEVFPGTFHLGVYTFRYATMIRTKKLTKGPNSEIHDLQWVPVQTILSENDLDTNRPLRLWKMDMAHPESLPSQLFAKFSKTHTRRGGRRTL